MKKITKIFILIFLLIFLNIFLFTNSSNAITLDELNGNGAETTSIQNTGGKLITVVSVIASIVSVVALIALGIKYMLGSVEEKAQYKKTLMPYIIGAVLVFAAASIASIIYNLF